MNRKRNVESIVNCLKEMIDRNGPSYLADEPYEIFRKLIEDGAADRQTAAVILYTLVSGVLESMESEGEPDILSEEIRRRCGLNKTMADQAANILHMLYSVEHEKEWERKKLKGLKQFLAENFSVHWEGFAEWDEGNGTVDCHYKAEIVLAPEEVIAEDPELARNLKKNPFMSKSEIQDLFGKRLKEYLDDEFEEYCTEDDYYQPVVEDFGANMEYDLPGWCRKNGFELISFEGDGEDGGYEPKFRRGWH